MILVQLHHQPQHPTIDLDMVQPRAHPIIQLQLAQQLQLHHPHPHHQPQHPIDQEDINTKLERFEIEVHQLLVRKEMVSKKIERKINENIFIASQCFLINKIFIDYL